MLGEKWKKNTKKAQRIDAAILSGDANRILLVCKRRAAVILYYNSLNAVTASKLPDQALLEKNGVGIKTIHAVRWAIETANKSFEELKRKERDLGYEIHKLKESLSEARARAERATGDKDLHAMFIDTTENFIAEKTSFLKDVQERIRKKK